MPDPLLRKDQEPCMDKMSRFWIVGPFLMFKFERTKFNSRATCMHHLSMETREQVTTHAIRKIVHQAIFSSQELKAFLFTCRPFVRPSVNFSHFHLLLQNHWVIFNHKASMVEGDSSLFKPYYELLNKNTLTKFKNFSRTTGPISTKLGIKHHFVKGTQALKIRTIH